MRQSRRASIIESVSNSASGFVIAVAAGYVGFPLIGYPVPSLTDNVIITAFFMAIGVMRGFLWRRLFEWLRVTRRLT